MTTKLQRRGFLAALSGALLLLAGCPSSNPGGDTPAGGGTTAAAGGGGGDKKLVIAWAQWKPADQLQKLTEDFTKESGIKVEVQQIPWSDFETKVNAAWTAKDSTFDMVVGDSQWLGKASTSGHYVDLSEWVNDPKNFPKADNEEAAVKNYGEYAGKLYAIPCMADGIAFAYRKDLFEDAAEKTAFKAKYNRELATPTTWDELQQVAEFFTRPDKKLYGVALFYSKEVDGATMGFDQVLWSFGGELQKDGKATGAINSPDAVKALEFYVGLKKFCPPGAQSFYFQQCNEAFMGGQVAMAENWFAFFPDLADPAKNKFMDKTGYFVVPKGPKGQFVSLGGQGLSLSSYSKNTDDAKKFLAWFSKEETQKKWVALGGLTANKKVAATDEFKKANPYNEVFAQTVPHLKDFDNSPKYSELLKISQDNLFAAASGAKTPKEALDFIAAEQDKVLSAK
ncbi:MAG: sugar ABC transporter substrate-binding protein [Armatimonas sp.]